MEIIKNAIKLIGNYETWRIVCLSFRISFLATLFSFIVSIPVSLLILSNMKKKRFFFSLLQALLFIPSVTLGLLIYLAISRKGFLGFLDLLYTPKAMILGQAILVFPLLTVFLINGLKEITGKIKDTLFTLGANFLNYNIILLKEAKFCLISSFIIGLSRAVGETGLAMVVGGNIKGETRVITTAIALHTMRGNFEIALSLGLILVLLAFLLNFSFQFIEKKWKFT